MKKLLFIIIDAVAMIWLLLSPADDASAETWVLWALITIAAAAWLWRGTLTDEEAHKMGIS